MYFSIAVMNNSAINSECSKVYHHILSSDLLEYFEVMQYTGPVLISLLKLVLGKTTR